MADPTDPVGDDDDNAGILGDSTGSDSVATNGPADPDAIPKRKRGRPAGSGKKQTGGTTADTGGKEAQTRSGKETRTETRKTASPLAVGDFAVQLQGMHKIAALALKNPLVEISDDESKKLAVAIQGVMKHHSINVSPVTMAWMQLLGVSAVVYGPRVALTLKAKQANRPAKVASQTPAQSMPTQNGGMDFTGQQPGKMTFQ